MAFPSHPLQTFTTAHGKRSGLASADVEKTWVNYGGAPTPRSARRWQCRRRAGDSIACRSQRAAALAPTSSITSLATCCHCPTKTGAGSGPHGPAHADAAPLVFARADSAPRLAPQAEQSHASVARRRRASSRRRRRAQPLGGVLGAAPWVVPWPGRPRRWPGPPQ